MKRTILALVIMLLMAAVGIHAQDSELPPPPDDIAEQLDALLETFATQGDATGAILLVQGPEFEYFKAAGVTAVDSDEPVTPNMHFQIGSNTKMMTSTIILQLHEEGLLNVDDPMSLYVPDAAARIPNGDDVTIRMLLKHNSGIWDYVDGTKTPEVLQDGLFWTALAGDITQGYTPQELLDFLVENGTPSFEPGSTDENGVLNFQYDNTGYLLLGMIIESVTGENVEDVFAERIFEPLGMEDTIFETGVAPAGLTPRGYYDSQDTTDFNLSMAWTAGAVISTPEDMAIFIRALLNGELYDDPATLELMQSDPKIAAPSGGNYAMGLQDKSYGDDLWGHGGQTLAFLSDVAYSVPLDVVIVAWSNTAENPSGQAAAAVYQILNPPPPSMTIADVYGTELALQSFANVEGEVTEITAPEKYTLTFGEDGQLAIQADCNQVTGSYTVDDLHVVTVELGVTTLVACGPDSFDSDFLNYLDNATAIVIYQGEGDGLSTIIVSPEGSLTLAVAEE